MRSSTIIPSANPPVKHMPTAPTPGPPHSSCTCFASARSHSVTGASCSVANAANSFETHAGIIDCTPYADRTAPSRASEQRRQHGGETASATRRAKSATFGRDARHLGHHDDARSRADSKGRVRAPLGGEREAVESFERVGRRFGHGRDHTVRLVP